MLPILVVFKQIFYKFDLLVFRTCFEVTTINFELHSGNVQHVELVSCLYLNFCGVKTRSLRWFYIHTGEAEFWATC